MPSVEVEKLGFQYANHNPLFENLSFTANTSRATGKIVAVMGTSGGGKTTLLRLIAGVEHPTSGRIKYDPAEPIISYLSQEPVLFEHLSKWKSISLFKSISSYRSSYNPKLLEAMVDRLGLRVVLDSSASLSRLSGGEKQRLCLARSLSITPQILLLDEPCTGLDAHVKSRFLRDLRLIVDEQKLLAFYVSHHGDEVRAVADEVIFIRAVKGHGDETIATSFTHQSLEEFISAPPSLEAIHASSSHLLNSLECVGTGRDLLLSGSTERLCSISGDEVYGVNLVVFGPEEVVCGASDSVRVRVVSQSGMCTFLSPESQPESIIMTNRARHLGLDRIQVDGKLVILPRDARFGTTRATC